MSKQSLDWSLRQHSMYSRKSQKVPFNCLLDITTWISHWNVKFNMFKTELNLFLPTQSSSPSSFISENGNSISTADQARKQKFILNTFFSLINYMQIHSFKIHLLSTSYIPGTDTVLNKHHQVLSNLPPPSLLLTPYSKSPPAIILSGLDYFSHYQLVFLHPPQLPINLFSMEQPEWSFKITDLDHVTTCLSLSFYHIHTP